MQQWQLIYWFPFIHKQHVTHECTQNYPSGGKCKSRSRSSLR